MRQERKMGKHLHRDLVKLSKEVLSLGGRVEEAINKAITALAERRPDLAEEVIQGDAVIDAHEIDVEENCLKILALHQPVAADLRFVVAVLKVNNDLERMGDHASTIASRAKYLSARPTVQGSGEVRKMAEGVRHMVSACLDSLVSRDTAKAREVCRLDDEIDSAHRRIVAAVQALMMEDPESVRRCVRLLSVIKQLERIGDLATNIAQDVIFTVEGERARARAVGELEY
jgi:phosphate transport system protein